jgi:hypothetical protein
MSHRQRSRLTPEEEKFFQALLWEEGRLVKGPATRTAEEHDLSLIRSLEPANRLSPNLYGEALNKVREGPCPPVQWPWPGMTGEEVIGLLWGRLVRDSKEPQEQGAVSP